MPKSYKEIHTQITDQYQIHYLNKPTSDSLAEHIKDLTLDDLLNLLEEIRDTPELTQISISLSRRSDLFDKLVLMKGEMPYEWVLRLHTYNMVRQCAEPGYVISNLNRKIRDDENHIHEHSWQLASRFLIGGFKNRQYVKTESGTFFNRYNLVSTLKDGASKDKTSRKAVLEGQTGIIESTEDLYQQGDIVHYPMEIPHKIDTLASAYLGMTMTLAHTSARHHENSIFYEKIQSNEVGEQMNELAIEAHKYTEESHLEALNIAITHLKLIKLCDHLAAEGFGRFNRFVDPITKQISPNNILETELLPTIAMLVLQKNEIFIEHPLTAELQGKSLEEIRKLKENYANTSEQLKILIEASIGEMHQPSLMHLISISQQNLMANLFIASRNSLATEVQAILEKRDKITPNHVLGRMSFFSSNQTMVPSTDSIIEKSNLVSTPSDYSLENGFGM